MACPRQKVAALVLALLPLLAPPLVAQGIPLDSEERTMVGAAVEVIGAGSAYSLPFMMIRSTHLGPRGVSPEFSIGLPIPPTLPLPIVDVGIGPTIRAGNSALVMLTAGISVIAVTLPGVRLGAGIIVKATDHLAVRFDLSGRWYRGPFAGTDAAIWSFSIGLTGLGTPH